MKTISVLFICFALLSGIKAQESLSVLPSKMPREQLIQHKGYSLSYSSAYVVSTWAAYKVSNTNVNKDAKPKAKYIPDPQVNTRSAEKKDYKDSGYIMAQLCSYLDVMHIDGAEEETFYMSNIVPMKYAFYTHIWLKTEDLIRLWVEKEGEFIVFTGAITKESPFPTFSKNKVAIPKNYYKVVYSISNQEAIAFKFKNGMSSGTLKSYAMPVNELEELTGIDFFPNMEQSDKDKLKTSVNYDFWNFELEDEL